MRWYVLLLLAVIAEIAIVECCQSTQYDKIDFYGDDLSRGKWKNVRSAARCCALCAKRSGCTHYTWHSKHYIGDAEKCYLKHGSGRRTRANHMVSGVMGGSSKPSAPSSSNNNNQGGGSTLDNERRQVLNAYNSARRRHGSAPLRLDSRINSVAQRYAERLARTNSFKHSRGSGYGENLHMQQHSGSRLDVQLAMKGLYWNEERIYNYNRPGFSSATGHFTAIVWRATTKIGVGVAKRRYGRSYKIYLVTNHSPAGNVRGRFRKNVLRPQ